MVNHTLWLTVTSCVLGAGIAVLLSAFVIVPSLKNTCTLFDDRCMNVEVKRSRDGTVLVRDPATSMMYFYDGNYIRAYGQPLPGECPSSVATENATGVTKEVEGGIPLTCTHFDVNGECVSQDRVAHVGRVMQGQPLAMNKGVSILEPTFVMNAKTLNMVEDQVRCSISRDIVETMFMDIPFKRVKLRVPSNTSSLDAFQLLHMLSARNVLPRPKKNPEPPVCSGNGVMDETTTQCVCNDGYTGPRCGTNMCVNDEQCGHGQCNAGLCECESGWGGVACNARTCDKTCVNGVCDGETGTCRCDVGFTGETCVEYECLPPCGDHGVCNPVNGVCDCEEGWSGQTCDNVACPDACSGNGQCLDPEGVCKCNSGWIGDACDTPVCTNNCNLRGTCDITTNTCVCDSGWSGDDCSTSLCMNGCCTHGQCEIQNDEYVCVCNTGWNGEDCSLPDNPLIPTSAWCPRSTAV